MTPNDLIDDLRSRINPAYAATLGTESYERRLCAETLEGLIAEQEELRDEVARLRTQRDYMLSAARRTLYENGHLADGDVCTLIVLKRAVETLAEVGAGEAAQPVEFLLNGARLKLSFQQEECESCGASSSHFRTVPMDQYAQELQGQWVALVPAENDRHLRMLATHNVAVSGTAKRSFDGSA